MAYEILTESYGRRLPKITAEADSTDDLATLGVNYAEGSTCAISDKTYVLDKVSGWVESGSGGGGGGGGVFIVNTEYDADTGIMTLDKTFGEIKSAFETSFIVIHNEGFPGEGYTETNCWYVSTIVINENSKGGTINVYDLQSSGYDDYNATSDDEYPSHGGIS